MKNNKIYVLCSDCQKPVGGIKQLYRHVDVLNKNGFSAYILHSKKDFRCTWFENDTRIAYNINFKRNRKLTKSLLSSFFNPFYILRCMFKFLVSSSYRTECFIRFKEKSLKFIAGKNKHQEIEINNNDYLCIPEVRGPNIGDIEKGLKKVILNQNPFYTFNKYSRNKEEMRTPYFEDDLAATIVFSENNLNYMKYVFPQLKLFRIHYGFDSELFNYCTQKKKQIAYMPRKLDKHVTQIINILKFKGALKDFKLVEIDNAKESKVAEVLRESLMFLSFSCDEGFGMPSAEAMACGCIVVGYDGEGGKEFFKKEFCYPIRYGDLVGFARTIEKIIKEYEDNQTYFLEKGRKASEFILKNYSLQKEEADIVRVWEEILGYHPKSLSNI